jgi:hypothetical protein
MLKRFSILFIGALLLFPLSSINPAWSQNVQAEKTSPITEPFVLKGTVASLSGSVKFRNEKTVLWQDLKLGQELLKGDHVRTERNGQVSIEFTNGNFLALKKNSAITITELNSDPSTGKYDMVFETIKAKIKAEANDHANLNTFEIHTPTAVAGVRGTIFFVNSTERFTDIFVERGLVNFKNDGFKGERQVPTGFTVTADETGEISEPALAEPEQMQEFQGFLEPAVRQFAPIADGSQPPPPPPPPPDGTAPLADGTQPPPPPGGFNSFVQNFQQNQQQFQQNQQMFFFDRQQSQEANKTEYISNPPPPTGSNSGDNDNDGIINSADTDDDNDFLLDTQETSFNTNPLNLDTDLDGITDWEEVRVQGTDPLDTDSDNDSIDDRLDAFPNDSAIFLESRAPIRTFRYNKIDAISGLRSEISSMLADSGSRQRDYIMDRVSDAQLHKVLKDRNNNWVRVEEYIFRPTSTQIDLLTLTYRTSAQLSSLYFSTIFNTSLNSLTSQQIKNLPWASYLSTTTPTYGATAPAYYPTQMNVKIASSTNSVEEKRTLSAPSFGGSWGQGIASNQMSVDGGAFNNFSTVNLISGNPAAFDYNYGSLVDFFVYVVNSSTGALAGGSYSYDSLWSVLGTNLSGHTSIPDGHHLEIHASYSGPTSINIIYLPMDDLLWRGDTNWAQELSW